MPGATPREDLVFQLDRNVNSLVHTFSATSSGSQGACQWAKYNLCVLQSQKVGRR